MSLELLRRPFGSTRPGRGALVATLFGLALALVISSVLVAGDGGEPVDVVSAAEARSALVSTARGEGLPEAPAAPATEPQDAADEPAADTGPVVYGPDVDDLVAHDVTMPPSSETTESDDAELASAPTAPSRPETTTTTAPPTTEPPTTAAEGEADPATDPTDPAADPDSPPPSDEPTDTTEPAADDPAAGEPTDPTEPPTTEPPTTEHPDGWVDAGHGVYVPPVMLQIRYCESRDNYTAANPSSSARGAYQFLKSSWAAYGHADRYGVSEAHLATPAQQDEAALLTWQRDGTRPWNASRHCWG